MSQPSFWAWSLERYGREGVGAALLALQDGFAFNVNLVLWCCWCAERFADLPEAAIGRAMSLCERWSAAATGPLRSARRALKTPPHEADIEAAQALRQAIKKAELDAEKIEQDMLEALAQDFTVIGADRQSAQERARRNIAAYSRLCGAAGQRNFTSSLLQTLIEGIFSYAEEDTGNLPAQE